MKMRHVLSAAFGLTAGNLLGRWYPEATPIVSAVLLLAILIVLALGWKFARELRELRDKADQLEREERETR